ncbi:T9SS type A sorting domain-containing protein [Ulvibacter antarcticus]|uniref:Putative secreted protein (Por secretion system target) n=1 Tax=Ulvibacter antarcticus TaxID=442714 RepID=A0A3L9Y8Z0_9FLAO|nr:T9SS type A sorting domain-containing protein [Ulvibacter antarcticus]RMA57163.1 putative secreted protein (Por secretion system target) [Ulvibacter antarcticus]
MKQLLLFSIALTFYTNTYAQIGFETHIIASGTNEVNRPYSVISADIDSDGYKDVLSASTEDGKIAWYRNLDGLGTFGPQLIISENADYATSVYAADIDGDGDLDVLSASFNDDKIAWYENLDGQGTFSTEQIITSLLDSALVILAQDVDGDGDLDVIAGSNGNSEIVWFENQNGLGQFSGPIDISENNTATESILAIDFDGDNDIDLVAALDYENKIVWYENTDGLGNFGSRQVITADVSASLSIFASDLDNDGDFDLLSTSFVEDEIVWFENMDGNGNFGTKQIITSNADRPYEVYSEDLDGDGDMDVFSASLSDNKIAWYENIDGTGSFGTQQIISQEFVGAVSVFADDLDNDGDIDVLSCWFGGDTIAWHENTGLLNVDENTQLQLSIFPNPTNNIFNIKSKTNIINVHIYNQLGQLVLEENNSEGIDKIQIDDLNVGLYFVKLKDANGNYSIQKILKY